MWNKELKTIVIGSVILGIVFGFDDKLPALNLPYFIINIIKFIMLSFIALIIHKKTQVFFATKVGAVTEISIWKAKRFWLTPRTKLKYPIPLGVIIPLIASFLSLGQVYFATPISTDIRVKPAYRLGRRFVKLTEFEYAKIAASAPLVHILLALILNPINNSIIKDFALVNTMLAVFLMLPLPGLLGATVLFGSRALYIFSAAFILTIALLTKILPLFSTLIIALVISISSLFYYLWRFYT